MAADPILRSAFISSAIEQATAHRFDGLDLAWQFPSSPADMANLAILLAEWRASLSNAAKDPSALLLLTATVYFSDHLFDGPTDDLDYPVGAVSENLDWVNILSFGYHRSSEPSTAADAPLYDRITHLSTSYGTGSWLDAGLPPCKLVMGIPLYGRSWYLKNKEKNGLGVQAVAAGPRQKQSNQTGLMAYFEIKEILKETATTLIYDNQTVSSYFHNGGLWVSFDNVEVVDEKIKFSLRNGLLGYFLWPINFDDSYHTISKEGKCSQQSFNFLLFYSSFSDPMFSNAASDVWQRYNASREGKLGYEDALSPQEMNAKDLAPNQSIDLSTTIEMRPQMTLHFCILLFLLLNLVKI